MPLETVQAEGTHLWSDGFSSDSGLRGTREEMIGMQ